VTWRDLKRKLKTILFDLRSALIIVDMLKSENVIVAEASTPTAIAYIPPKGIDIALFEVFDKIKKLNDNLFHSGIVLRLPIIVKIRL